MKQVPDILLKDNSVTPIRVPLFGRCKISNFLMPSHLVCLIGAMLNNIRKSWELTVDLMAVIQAYVDRRKFRKMHGSHATMYHELNRQRFASHNYDTSNVNRLKTTSKTYILIQQYCWVKHRFALVHLMFNSLCSFC